MLASEIPFFSVGYIQSLIIIHYSVYPAFIINFIESSTQTERLAVFLVQCFSYSKSAAPD